jgi:Replication-relaxation
MEEVNPSSKTPIRIGEVDEGILRAINRFHYMTAAQVSRLFYPECHDDDRYSQRRLRRLAQADYLLRLRALPTPRIGSAPHVFALADRGRKYLAARGVNLTSPYFRPSEEQQKAWDTPFMLHTLATVDVLVQAARLAGSGRASMPRLLTERQLRRNPVKVVIPGRQDRRPVAVIPDAWFQLRVGTGPAFSFSLELDRGSEDQKAWRRKIAALAAWAVGPYKEAFATDNLTIAVVTPDANRRNTLNAWTVRELSEVGMPEVADVFLFTSVDPVACTPEELFFGRVWYPAGERAAVSLLEDQEGQATTPYLASP